MRARCRQADALHGLAEELAVLRLVDGVRGGADHLDVEFFQHAHLAQAQRAVQRRLSAHRRQQRIGAFAFDDLGDDLRRDRLDICRVGEIGIGHDRRRVRVHQDDPVALFLERLARLRARVVELAGLADHDRARADDQDRFDVGSLGHVDNAFLFAIPGAAKRQPGMQIRALCLCLIPGPACGRRMTKNSGHKKRARKSRVPGTALRGRPRARWSFRPDSTGREGLRRPIGG